MNLVGGRYSETVVLHNMYNVMAILASSGKYFGDFVAFENWSYFTEEFQEF